jgi:twitching motility protein PilT
MADFDPKTGHPPRQAYNQPGGQRGNGYGAQGGNGQSNAMMPTGVSTDFGAPQSAGITPQDSPPQSNAHLAAGAVPYEITQTAEANPADYFINCAHEMHGGHLRTVEDVHLDELLHIIADNGSSDLHLAAGIPPIIRHDGKLLPAPFDKMTAADTQRMMYDILTDEQIQKFESTWELDFSYALAKKARFRINMYKDMGTVAAALRLIPTRIPDLKGLGYSPVLEKLTHEKRGLVLVTGPTGSGKSTTLAAMINGINLTRSEHILTIEDPIEYLHTHKHSVINQRELGMDTKSFPAALRAALREDPDVILVGEMRDLETMQLAISAAETGHLVFATLHTNSAATTVDRIVDVFPTGQQGQIRLQLSNNLIAVICQTLIPRANGPGRLGVQEIMIATAAIRNLIREAKAHQLTSIIQTSAHVGMITMDQNLRDHYLAGKITYDEAVSRALNQEELKRMLADAAKAGGTGQRPQGPGGPPMGQRPPGPPTRT